jgi:hypothetical protein
MLLTAEENGFSNKTDTSPAKWFAPQRFKSKVERDRNLNLHLIPDVPEIWQLDNFARFIEAHSNLGDRPDLLVQEK